MKDTAPQFEPSSAMGADLRYLQNQWFRFIAFLDDPLIPIHNNASESALRIVALARSKGAPCHAVAARGLGRWGG
jgi:hypothetical protein